jgi:hypothetical protein
MPRTRVFLAVQGVLSVAFTGLLLTWLVGAVGRAREEARAAQCVCNLACLEAALRRYESTYGTLPPAAIADANGKPLLSWRVAILPFIGEGDLYKQIKLDEPWNGPNNCRFNSIRPSVFLCPCHIEGADKGFTDYLVVVGSRTLFPGGGKGRKRAEIRDDPASTLVVVESMNSAINWMEPRDLVWDRMSFRLDDHSRPSISSNHHYGSYPGPHVIAAGARASPDNQVVASLGGSITPEAVKSLLIIDDGRDVPLRRGPWLD